MGEIPQWDAAEKYLEDALEEKRHFLLINAGDGAFYGPKIDFDVKDALGRGWQLATIQVDFQMPQRFGCQYEGRGRQAAHLRCAAPRHHRRLERFLGVLTENYAGQFPVWLSPVQVTLLSVSDPYNEFAEQLAVKMRRMAYAPRQTAGRRPSARR